MASKPQKLAAAGAQIDRGPRYPLNKATAKDWADAWVKELAPNETFWRKLAKPTSRQQFIEEQSINGAAMAESLLGMLGTGTWPTLDDCIPEGTILDVVDKFFYQATDLPREL